MGLSSLIEPKAWPSWAIVIAVILQPLTWSDDANKAIKAEVTALQTDVSKMKTDVAVLQNDVSKMKTDVAVLQNDVSRIKGDISELKVDMKKVLERLPKQK